MSYPYGTQGAPAVGAGAPGLPQRTSSAAGGDIAGAPQQRLLVRAADLYATTPFLTPDWSSYCRVTALGRGGFGLGGTVGGAIGANGAPGGGGAGLAATNIEPTPAGTPINIAFTSTATTAAFLNYQLSGGNGGDATTSAGGAGGVGSGGAINFFGGSGSIVGSGNGGAGGGAAGRGGTGASASSQTPGFGGLGDAYATGGGAGGAAGTGSGPLVGAISRLDGSLAGATVIGLSTINQTTPGAGAANSNGGDGGGGAGGSINLATPNAPGAALVLIELW